MPESKTQSMNGKHAKLCFVCLPHIDVLLYISLPRMGVISCLHIELRHPSHFVSTSSLVFLYFCQELSALPNSSTKYTSPMIDLRLPCVTHELTVTDNRLRPGLGWVDKTSSAQGVAEARQISGISCASSRFQLLLPWDVWPPEC